MMRNQHGSIVVVAKLAMAVPAAAQTNREVSRPVRVRPPRSRALQPPTAARPERARHAE
jgi:hypothetical protein